MVLKLIDEAEAKYGIVPCKFSYSNIINCYARLNQPNEAENVFREMVDKGIKPDVVTYTTLINAFNRAKNIDRCWQIYNDIQGIDLDNDIDEFLLSYMVRLTAATHESEKALKIFSELELNGFTE